jgi:hypothetical protein
VPKLGFAFANPAGLFKELNMSNSKITDEKTKKAATGVGAAVGGAAGGVAGGMAAGAAIGGMTGPVGAAVGAAAGAAVGALTGRGVAATADPDMEESYWRDNYTTRPYVANGHTYDDYGPAYRYGAEAYNRHPGRAFDDVESDLERDWDTSRGRSNLRWEHAKHASRDAWQRVSDTLERAIPGDSDRDGR